MPAASEISSSPTKTRDSETGLLTRWVPDWLKHSALYRSLRFLRILQFLCSIASLGIFSRYYEAHLELYPDPPLSVDHPFRAVEGILAAAVVYTLLSLLLTAVLREAGPKLLRWIWVLLDIIFVGAFIVVAVFTSPRDGRAISAHCLNHVHPSYSSDPTGEEPDPGDDSCQLVMGTFVLAIITSVLQAMTAMFHEVYDHRTHRGPCPHCHDKEEDTGVIIGHREKYQWA
ncbi:hypothetical protein GGS20DRAFT_596162 [Poronia punctata]|nr:hypothetical protein GGS20DRAFT_596162 [Poronia punctata]